jgi:hypothetical protein
MFAVPGRMRGKKKAPPEEAATPATAEEAPQPLGKDESTSTEPPQAAEPESAAPPAAPPGTSEGSSAFEENEIVLAKDNNKLYDAKVRGKPACHLGELRWLASSIL